MRYKLVSLFLLTCLLISGCAYNREFYEGCEAAVPAMRDYATVHLPDLTEEQKQVIATTEPRTGHANYVEVHFKWTNVCDVVSGAPPKCEPFRVDDLRAKK